MKREDVKALAGNPYPNTFDGYKRLLRSTLIAISEEPTLQVVDQKLFDDLMEFKDHPALLSAFFYKHNMEDMSYFQCRKVIAKDKDGDLVLLNRDFDGQYIEVRVPIGVGEPYIRFGLTDVENQHRYDFFMTSYVYTDYHDPMRTKGNARKMKVKSAFGWDTRYCDEDGRSNILTNIEGMVKEFIGIFRHFK